MASTFLQDSHRLEFFFEWFHTFNESVLDNFSGINASIKPCIASAQQRRSC